MSHPGFHVPRVRHLVAHLSDWYTLSACARILVHVGCHGPYAGSRRADLGRWARSSQWPMPLLFASGLRLLHDSRWAAFRDCAPQLMRMFKRRSDKGVRRSLSRRQPARELSTLTIMTAPTLRPQSDHGYLAVDGVRR